MADDRDLYHDGTHEADDGTLDFFAVDVARAADARTIRLSDIGRCPHCILVPEHYREDGSCRCDDPDAAGMAEAGYVWVDGAGWVAPDEAE